MSVADKACQLAIKIANDDSHGYSQQSRDGNPDFDCSSLVIWLWQQCGVDVKGRGASYTGNMCPAFLQAGFRLVNWPEEDLEPGDVLLNVKHHAALYVGNNRLVQATIAETGTVHGQPGDQTGSEIGIFPFYNYPWDYILRYKTAAQPATYNISYGEADMISGKLPVLQRGEWGPGVAAMQGALAYHGFIKTGEISGMLGEQTEKALLNFQTKHGIEVDGICGPETWTELFLWR